MDEPAEPLPEPIDRAHLAAQTMGDDALARELLALFAGQAELALAEIETAASAGARGEWAHRLKGAARAVGAWEVAAAAARAEGEAGDASLAHLRSAVDRAGRAVANLLA